MDMTTVNKPSIMTTPAERQAMIAGKKTQHRILSTDEDVPLNFKIGDLIDCDGLIIEATGLRREKVQDISQDDVLASGLPSRSDGQGFYWYENSPRSPKGSVFYLSDYKDAFETYWTLKHGAAAWADNHDVWVLTFAVVEVKPAVESKLVDVFADFLLINGTKLDLMKCPDNRLLMTTADHLSGDSHHDKMLEREALRLRDWLLAMYPLECS